MPGGIHPGHGPEGWRAARRGAAHTGMMPSGVHGNNVYRNSFLSPLILSPLTLSGFLALLTLSVILRILRILQAYTTKCVGVAVLR